MTKRQHPMPPGPRGEAMATLATRIPKSVHRRLRLYCVERDVMVQDVVEEALRERLHPGSEPRQPVKARASST